MSRRSISLNVRQVLVAALCLTGLSQAAADPYPTRPVRLIVSYAPGGTSDLVGRAMAQKMGALLGQSFVIENRGGAGGMIGADIVAKAPADGYTFLVAASGPIAFLPALSERMPYDVERDFATVGNLVTVPNLVLVRPGGPFKSLAELVAFAKKPANIVKFGSAGIGSSGHISGELLNTLAGIRMEHVPYRGSGPAMLGLIAGDVDVMFDNLPSAMTQVQGGNLTGLAVMSRERSVIAPQFPTTAEVGFPDFLIGSSTGLLAPKNTPQAAITAVEKALRYMAEDPETRAQLAKYSADLDFMDSAAYRAWIHAEIARWSRIGREASIRIH